MLSLVSIENTDNLFKKDENGLCIGSFSYKTKELCPVGDEFVEIISEENVDYVLKKKLFSYSLFMISPDINSMLEQPMVNIKGIPDKIYPHYFSDERKQKRLIKKINR